MKYVLLGNLSPQWANKQSERVGKAKAKLDKLGIKIESIHYTQGYYDFVDVVDVSQAGSSSCLFRLVLQSRAGADPKHAGLRGKGL